MDLGGGGENATYVSPPLTLREGHVTKKTP